MSRSNPTDNTPNPAVRWFEWNGEQGNIRYYDKDAKKNVTVPLPFTFILLDELGCAKGWHDASGSGIFSNEVRDTRQDVMLVKSFKGGTIAEGLYKDIKDRIGAAGGHFTANCYIAFKHNGGLAIGSLQFKGAALGAWMEFRKAHRGDLYEQAIEIHAFTEGQKGRVIFKMPSFRVVKLSEATNAEAVKLDQKLQEFLTAYLKRTKRDQVDAPPHERTVDEALDDEYPPPVEPTYAPSDEDIPF